MEEFFMYEGNLKVICPVCKGEKKECSFCNNTREVAPDDIPMNQKTGKPDFNKIKETINHA